MQTMILTLVLRCSLPRVRARVQGAWPFWRVSNVHFQISIDLHILWMSTAASACSWAWTLCVGFGHRSLTGAPAPYDVRSNMVHVLYLVEVIDKLARRKLRKLRRRGLHVLP